MKKLAGIEIIIIVVSLMVMGLAIVDAYRISSLFHGMPMEQSYIYDTTIFGVPLTIFLLYIVVFIKYKKQEDAKAYIMIRLFPSIIFGLYVISYLIGLNYENMRSISGAFTYELLVPLWVHIIFFIGFMSLNIYLFKMAFDKKWNQRIIDIYSGVLVVFYLILFSSVITDSASYLGLFEWT